MPQRMLGLTMLRRSRCQSRKPTRPAAVAAPGPALEPEAAFLKEPGIHGLPAEPNVVERERAEAELRQEHGASGV